MQTRRLSWAGIEVCSGDARLLIDPLEDATPLADFLGAPRAPPAGIDLDHRTWVAVTHLHRDHCDRALLGRLGRQRALCHAPVAAELAEEGIVARGVALWEPLQAGPFRLTPVPSHDWRGDDQVAWVVQADDHRIIHCGDTIWHGHWYAIAHRYAPFDAAFLPINGVLARLDGLTPTDVPATLTPEQAVEAAVVLEARLACGIHHGTFHNPPRYTEQPDARERFLAAGARRGIAVTA